jgi:hypothetical protein
MNCAAMGYEMALEQVSTHFADWIDLTMNCAGYLSGRSLEEAQKRRLPLAWRRVCDAFEGN